MRQLSKLFFGATANAMSLVFLLTACASPPVEHFHTLRPLSVERAQSAMQVLANRSKPVVAVGPVSIPELLDRPQWVLRKQDHGVQILEQQRWAQSLPQDLAQAVAEFLNPVAVAYADNGEPTPGFVPKSALRVHIQVVKLDTILDHFPRVDDHIRWTAACTGPLPVNKPSVVRTGMVTVNLPLTQVRAGLAVEPLPETSAARQAGASLSPTKNAPTIYDHFAAAHSQVIRQLSHDIAAALPELLAECPPL